MHRSTRRLKEKRRLKVEAEKLMFVASALRRVCGARAPSHAFLHDADKCVRNTMLHDLSSSGA